MIRAEIFVKPFSGGKAIDNYLTLCRVGALSILDRREFAVAMKHRVVGFALGVVLALLAGCALPQQTLPPATAPIAAPTVPTASEDRRTFDAAERLAQERPEKAEAAYADFVARFPHSPLAAEALMRIGRIQRDEGQLAKARSAFERILTQHGAASMAGSAAFQLLSIDYELGDFRTLVARAAQFPYERFNPSDRAAVWEMLSDAHLALDEPVEAVYDALRAWETIPDERRQGLIPKIRLALERVDQEAVSALLGRPLGENARQLLQTLAQEALFDRHLIGCLLPMTGSHATYGQRALRGVELALSRFTDGSDTYPVRLVVEDTASSDDRAAAAVEALNTKHVAAIIGPMATAAAAAEAAQAHHIPIVTFTQRESVTAHGDYVFRHFITPQMQVEALVQWAVESGSMNRFAVLYPSEKYGQTFLEQFERAVGAFGAKITRAIPYDPTQTDFAGEIRQLISGYAPVQRGDRSEFSRRSGLERPTHIPILDFDALFIPEAPSKAGLILPQLAYHDITSPVLMGTNLWQSQALLDMAGRYVEGAVFTTAFFEADETPEVADFVAYFKALYGEAPGFIEAVAYDTTLMLCEILQRPDARSRAQIRDILRQSTFPRAVTGETRFRADGEARKALRLIGVRDGAFMMLDILPAVWPPEGR